MEPALLELYAEGVPDDEVAVILRLTDPAVIPDGVRIVARFGLIATCRVRRGDIPRLWSERSVESVKRPRPYGPTLDESEDLAEADVEMRPSDVRRPEGLKARGRNVCIAHIDWGVDPGHRDFRNEDGSTRLLAIWDQAAPVDPGNPNPYGYGRIHRQADINRALSLPDPYAALGYWPAASDPAGIGSHGTHTLGISAGNGRSGGPIGLAPEADLIFVHFSTSTSEGPVLLGDSVAFLEALDFISKVAAGRQLVINASLGRQCGQHDGQTLTERGMDAFLRATDGRAICFSAGNYYSRDMHTEGLLRPGERKAFRFALHPSYGGTNEIDLWYPGVDRFGITVIAPDGSKVSAAPDGRAAVTVDGRAVGRLYHRIGDPNNGDNQVSLFLDPGAPRDVWQIELNGIDVADGRFHAWIERTAGGARRHARFLPEDIDRTCTTGTICNGHWTIATGAYDRHQAGRPLARFSSSGPTRDGRPKPDLLAPGVRVLSARSHPRNAAGDASLLSRMSGTSMAAPHVAGTIALMFSAAPRPLSVAETRRLLLGSVDPPKAADGDERWRMGSGFLNTAAAVEAAASLAGLGEAVVPAESEQVAASAIVMAAQGEASETVSDERASADETAPEDIEMADERSEETASGETTAESDAEGIAIENLAIETVDEPGDETAPDEAMAESDADEVAVEAASEELDEAQASEVLAEDLEAYWPPENLDELTHERVDELVDEQADEQSDEQDQEQDGETADGFAALEEASMAKKRSQIRRRRRAGGSALPFQVQVPLTGGSPALALPLGGGVGSPFAFTVPLGGTPAPQQPQPQPVPQPAMPAVAAGAPGAEPAPDAPVVVAGDVPLYEPPSEPPSGEDDEAEWIGEDILEAADEAALNDDGRRLSSSTLLQNLVQSGLGTDDPIALSPLGAGRPGPSATALFRALAYADDTGWRDALQRHYRSRFTVLARPGNPCSVMPRPGDLLIRCARGEGWATLAVVASPGLYRHHELPSLGLRAEGYPRVRPGLYVHVVEPGPRPYPAAARFARRLGDIGSTTLGDTLLLRLRPPGSFGEAEPAPAPANGVRAKELRSGASGAAVRDVQAQLNRVHADLVALGLPGLEGGPLGEDGRFTARMERMVQAFQQTVFNDPGRWDGVVRSDTLTELRKLTGAAPTAAPRPPAAPVFPPFTSRPAPSPAPELEEGDYTEGSGPTFVRWIQASLNRAMNAGLAEDGQMGPRTRTAIRAFQQRAGLVADGIVGPRTEAALRAAVEGQSGGGGAKPAVVCRGIAAREVIDRFEFNRPEMPASGQPTVDNIAACIAESRRGSNPIRTLRVVGHTDPVGSDTDNDRLGTNRANAVRDALRTALRGRGIPDADVVINVETRGEREVVPGDPALTRRVEIFPPRAFTPTAAAAKIEVVLDDNNDTIVDAAAPVTTFVRFGLWDQGYDASGNVRNGQAETANFIGQDRRRFYLRVRDPAATAPRVNATWKTLRADGRTDDDAPASQVITLTETASGSRVYVSKAIMLVTDDTDARQPTHSGLSPPLADATVRNRGQSNHRLRRASMNGFLSARYVPASGTAATVTLPVFVRTPKDERRRVRVRVINYNTSATAAYITGQFEHANLRWNQIGLAIQAQATVNRVTPAGVIGADGTYAGSINNAPETAALNDLVPITPNNTVTAVFVPLSGANAYATIGQRTTVALGDRYFIFIDDNLSLNDETLAHELAHVLFNRFDGTTARRFYTLNTNPPSSFGVPLPDPRIYRRIQNQNSADPDNDAPNDNIVNWARRVRGARFPIGGALDAPTATTGNKLTETL